MSQVLTLGEILLRFTPQGKRRIHSSSQFDVTHGGAEINVAVSLSNFGHHVSLLSAIPDNELGVNCVNFLHKHQIDISNVLKLGGRLGFYFVEEGYSIRPSQVIYDRDHSSFIKLPTVDLNWDEVFQGVDVLHVSGITPALSESLRAFTLKAVREGNDRGVQISFDCNYRQKLWLHSEAKSFYEAVLPFVDIGFIGYKDMVNTLGFEVTKEVEKEQVCEWYELVANKYDISTLASTARRSHGAAHHSLKGFLYHEGHTVHTDTKNVEALDRIGAGDSFASGVIHGLLKGWSSQQTINFAVSSALLKHTVVGDHNPFSEEEILDWMSQERLGDMIR